MYGFRDNEYLLQAGYDVIMISPPGSAARTFLIADSENPNFIIMLHHLRRGSAKQSVKNGLGSLWQHGNFNASQLRNLSSYNHETLHV